MDKWKVVLQLVLFIHMVFIFPEAGWAESFSGRVVKVVDGRTLDVFYNTTRVRVRVIGDNCLNYSAPYSRQTRETLEFLVAGQVVTVKVIVRRCDLVEGEVLLAGGTSICQELERILPGGKL